MKSVLTAAILVASLASSSSIASASESYTDKDGITWTVEGPAVGRWRPFPDAAARCPSHHVIAEPRKLYDGGYSPSREERAADKAAGVQTMHIKCLAATPPTVSAGNPPEAKPPLARPEPGAPNDSRPRFYYVHDGKI